MSIRWCILQYVSKINSLAFSRNSSLSGTVEKLLSSTLLPRKGSLRITCNFKMSKHNIIKPHEYRYHGHVWKEGNWTSHLSYIIPIVDICYLAKEKKKAYFFTFPHLLLCPIKVIVDVNTSQKLSDGIFIRMLLLLNNFNKVFELWPPSLVNNECCGQVS